jgi:hypothetical protein
MTEELPAEAAELTAMIVQADADFLQMTHERYIMGEKKYGPVNFMTVDSIEMALEEVADLANYARFTWIKLRLLQQSLVDVVPNDVSKTTIGAKSFISNLPGE